MSPGNMERWKRRCDCVAAVDEVEVEVKVEVELTKETIQELGKSY